MEYDWPGNIRELMNCLERMMSFNSGPLLHFGDLPSPVANYSRARNQVGLVATAAAGAGAHSMATAVTPPRSIVPLQELEKRAIQNALVHTRGDRTTAAQLLGIGRTTLYRKLKEYEIE